MRTHSAVMMVLLVAAAVLGGCESGPPGSAPEQVRPLSKTGESPDDLIKKLEEQIKQLEQSSQPAAAEARLDDSETFTFDLSTAPSMGPEDAKLTMVAWSEFPCPFCQRFAVTSHQVAKKFPDDLRVVFMHFPLQDECNDALNRPFHPTACMAAYAAKAAQDQGRFWEMHDWLFQNQRNITAEGIIAFAEQAGMDAAKVRQAMETKQYKEALKAEAQQLTDAGGRGTPTVFINGKKTVNVRWDNPGAVEEFISKLLDPEEQAEEVGGVKPAVSNPGDLPQAAVVLSDGTRLEDRLKDLSERLAKVSRPAPEEKPRPEPKRPDPNTVYQFNQEGRPTLGPANAAATLVVFTNFTCPHCARMADICHDLAKQFPNDLRVVFKHTPNPGHRNSLEAHEAAEEAMVQGKFWEFHDEVFKNRDKLSPEFLRQIAQDLGMDLDRYDKAVAANTHRQKLIADVQDADQANVNATPTVFINGKHQANNSKEALAAAIKAAAGK